jgi:hypothetical protein
MHEAGADHGGSPSTLVVAGDRYKKGRTIKQICTAIAKRVLAAPDAFAVPLPEDAFTVSSVSKTIMFRPVHEITFEIASIPPGFEVRGQPCS